MRCHNFTISREGENSEKRELAMASGDAETDAALAPAQPPPPPGPDVLPPLTYADLRSQWRNAEPEFSCRDSSGTLCLTILGAPVMEDWELPYMEALADVACHAGGRVLEVGYGLGLSAQAIEDRLVRITPAPTPTPTPSPSPTPTLAAAVATQPGDVIGALASSITPPEHVVIEANAEVAGLARRWAATAKAPTTVLEGFWQEETRGLADGSFDGILFDVYPLTSEEVIDGECDSFFATAARLLRRGGCLTFYFDIAHSWSAAVKTFDTEVTEKLLAAGFARVESGDCVCHPPSDCEYFWKDRFIVPRAVR